MTDHRRNEDGEKIKRWFKCLKCGEVGFVHYEEHWIFSGFYSWFKERYGEEIVNKAKEIVGEFPYKKEPKQ